MALAPPAAAGARAPRPGWIREVPRPRPWRPRAASCSPTPGPRSSSGSPRSPGRPRRVPLLPAIDPGLDGTSLAGPSGGLLLWIAFGLVGSLRVLPIPGSSAVWTFHFPFVAAAMVLGGPTAGAWVGFLATLERRELESQPWYGTLANHAVIAFGAVVGGLTVLVVRGALASINIDPGAAGVLAIAAGTLVLAVTVNGVAAGTIILRERLAPMAVVDILVRSLGRVTLAEIVLASVFTVAYVAVGWWAPLALAVVVLLIWPGEGFEGIDPLMKLPRRTRVQAGARVHGRSNAARARAGRPAAGHRPRRLRPAQQGLRHARRRRGPRGDRRAAPCAGADDGHRRRASAGTSSRCSTGARSTPRPPSGSRPAVEAAIRRPVATSVGRRSRRRLDRRAADPAGGRASRRRRR